jgi:cell division protein FtsW (lipid II flippase)
MTARDRWVMSVEARGLTVLRAVLATVGIAVLYSASAIVAMQADRASWHFAARQAVGLGVGLVAFAIASKFDAERLDRLACGDGRRTGRNPGGSGRWSGCWRGPVGTGRGAC